MRAFSLPGVLLTFSLIPMVQAAVDVIGGIELTQGVPLTFVDESATQKTTYDITYEVASYGFSVPHDINKLLPEPCKTALALRKFASIVPAGTNRAALNRYRDNQLLLEISVNPGAQDKADKLLFPIHPPEEYAEYTLLAENAYLYNDLLPVVLFKGSNDQCLVQSGFLDISDIEKKKNVSLELTSGCQQQSSKFPHCMESYTRRRVIGGMKLKDSSAVYYFLDQNDELEPGQQFTYFKPGMAAPSPVIMNPAVIDGHNVNFDYSQKLQSVYAGLNYSDNHYFVVNPSASSDYIYLLIDKSQANALTPVARLEINKGSQLQQLSLQNSPEVLAFRYREEWCMRWLSNIKMNGSAYEKFTFSDIDACFNPLISNNTSLELRNFKVGESWQPVISNMGDPEADSNHTSVLSVLGLFEHDSSYSISDAVNQRLSKEGLPELNLVYQNDYSRTIENGFQQVMVFSASNDGNEPFTSIQLIATYKPETTPSDNSISVPLLAGMGTAFVVATIATIAIIICGLYRNREDSGYSSIN